MSNQLTRARYALLNIDSVTVKPTGGASRYCSRECQVKSFRDLSLKSMTECQYGFSDCVQDDICAECGKDLEFVNIGETLPAAMLRTSSFSSHVEWDWIDAYELLAAAGQGRARHLERIFEGTLVTGTNPYNEWNEYSDLEIFFPYTGVDNYLKVLNMFKPGELDGWSMPKNHVYNDPDSDDVHTLFTDEFKHVMSVLQPERAERMFGYSVNNTDSTVCKRLVSENGLVLKPVDWVEGPVEDYTEAPAFFTQEQAERFEELLQRFSSFFA